MADTYTKSGSEMVITSQVINKVDYKGLQKQKVEAEQRVVEYQAQLDAIKALIAEADKLGLKTKE
jgi:hypothetical protein